MAFTVVACVFIAPSVTPLPVLVNSITPFVGSVACTSFAVIRPAAVTVIDPDVETTFGNDVPGVVSPSEIVFAS